MTRLDIKRNMLDLASHIVARSQKFGKPVTNLHLQKILYFALSEAKEKQLLSEDELRSWYDLPFLVWRYGPVVEAIYLRYNIFGASNIFIPGTSDSRFDVLNGVIDTLLEKSPFELIKRTTEQDIYKANKHLIKNGKTTIPYSFKDLKI